MLFLTPREQHQSTEGKKRWADKTKVEFVYTTTQNTTKVSQNLFESINNHTIIDSRMQCTKINNIQRTFSSAKSDNSESSSDARSSDAFFVTIC